MIPGPGPYGLQCLRLMQGTKLAGRAFYKLLKAILGDVGVAPTSIDSGFYVFVYKDKSLVFLVTKTDDFLLSTNLVEAYNLIKQEIACAFGVLLHICSRINYLNLWIYQSKFGISIDHTSHILRMVEKHFGSSFTPSKMATPLLTDKQFDKDIMDDKPADVKELKRLEKQFGSLYLSLYGDVQHVSVASQPDLSNVMNRLGFFQSAPSKLGFDSIHRVYKYLATHPDFLLFYPAKPLTLETLFQSFKSTCDPAHRLIVPHFLCSHLDSSFAPFLGNRHLVSGHIETIGTVAVGWNTSKQVTCATSDSDAETRAYFKGG